MTDVRCPWRISRSRYRGGARREVDAFDVADRCQTGNRVPVEIQEPELLGRNCYLPNTPPHQVSSKSDQNCQSFLFEVVSGWAGRVVGVG